MNVLSQPRTVVLPPSSMGTGSKVNIIEGIGKIVFVLFCIWLGIKLYILFLSWMYASNDSPHLIDGMVDGKTLTVFEQNPNVSGSKPIYRSQNQDGGLEFTWSTWIYINDMQYLAGKYRHIFHKGNNEPDDKTGMNEPNNAPGLYIAPTKNDLVVVMNTFNTIQEEVRIEDVPLNKWVNVMIRVEGRKMDVFINGMIAKSHMLSGVVKQNYGNVYVGANGGFDGYVSNLWYFNHAVSLAEIQSILSEGANTAMVGSSSGLTLTAFPYYISSRWYFGQM